MKLPQIISVLLMVVSAHSSSASTADVVFINAKIYNVNEHQPWADSIVIEDNRIVSVGSDNAVKSYIDSGARVVDLNGKLVLPGLIDEHVHPDMAAERLVNIDLLPSEMSWQQQKETIS